MISLTWSRRSASTLCKRFVTYKGAQPWPVRSISATAVANDRYRCKFLVLGCGSGGCSVAAQLTTRVGKQSVIVVDPAEEHYYQPMFTMIGGGMKTLAESVRPMSQVVPDGVQWIADKAHNVDAEQSVVTTVGGHDIEYEVLVVAVGMRLNYEKIPGLVEALEIPNGNVTSIYSPKYVNRHLDALKRFESGNIIFTFPASPCKCPGAPQKICYITEHYLRMHNKREAANIKYISALPVIFGVKYFADALWKVANERAIEVQLKYRLIEVLPKENLAVFESIDEPHQQMVQQYSLLHVTPPQEPSSMLCENPHLTNEAGFVDVHRDTLQHNRYPNIFAIGDCSSTPNSKTMAAAAAQSSVVVQNIMSHMDKRPLTAAYDGYASCPLVTGYDSCILAEFDYDLQPLETFPVAQDRERYSMFLLKRYIMPELYWRGMLPGWWTGPSLMRKMFSFIKPSRV